MDKSSQNEIQFKSSNHTVYVEDVEKAQQSNYKHKIEKNTAKRFINRQSRADHIHTQPYTMNQILVHFMFRTHFFSAALSLAAPLHLFI